MPTGGRDVAHEGVSGAGGCGVGRVYRPGNHLHFRPGVGLTGVEPAVGGEGGIDDEGHQAGLSRNEQVAKVGADGLDRPVGQPTAQPASPLGEQQRPVGRKGEPPRYAQARDERDDGEVRGDRLGRGSGGPHQGQQNGIQRRPQTGGAGADRTGEPC